MGRDSLTLDQLIKTKAFKRRNAEWPCTRWDYTEWEECKEEAKQELKNHETHTI